MFGLVTRRVQNSLICQLTRRNAHSGLLELITLRPLPTRTYHLLDPRTFPPKDTQLWSFDGTRRGFKCRPFRMALNRKVSSPPLLFLCSSSSIFILLLHRKVSKSRSFLPLKDSYGTTQLVVERDNTNVDKFAALSAVPPESVVLIQGRVRSRPDHSKRPVSFYSTFDLVLRFSMF